MAAVEGPVIVVNISQMESNAIMVLSHRLPILVRLPDATPDVILGLLNRTNAFTSQNDMKTILKALWHLIVQPIVTILLDEVKLRRGSRIWWCPTGVTSLLPLHAAGDYSKRGETLPDRFISSYTATLTFLIRARANLPKNVTANPDLFILGQSQDPTLPTVHTEIGAIQRIVKNAAVLDGIDATRDSAVHSMTRHSWVHLACHGHVDEEHPFKTHFSLSDGPLTLLDIARQNIPHAYLAFLSSCHSAEGNRGRPDEVLHLTAGVQFAGFRSVVGTLWAMDGEDGPTVAETFYSNLLGLGPKPTNSPAVALHRAVAELRRRNVSITRWACFVHYGC
jgi:CHAT domain-containing protein